MTGFWKRGLGGEGPGRGRASPGTCWDKDDGDAHEAAQNQSQHLAPLAAQPLHHEDAAVASGHLNGSED